MGNLHKGLSALTGSSIEGTEKEKKKYNLIYELFKLIQYMYNLGVINQSISNLKYIGLVLCNIGTDIDEDIEVTLIIPEQVFISAQKISKMIDDNKQFITSELDLDEIFKIHQTAEYLSYDNSKVKTQSDSKKSQPLIFDLFGKDSYNKTDFLNSIIETWEYDTYILGDKYILKVKFDYIKHNSSIAFPVVLLFNDMIDKIEYTITSRNCIEVINGIVNVES